MIVVIFEVTMKPGCEGAYFDLAAALRRELEKVDGFLSVERFESLSTPGKYLSLSFWRDEAAVRAWREQPDHRRVQQTGKEELFADFRISVAEIARQYSLRDRVPATPEA